MEIIELTSLLKTGTDAQLYERLVAIDRETEWTKICRGKIEAELNRRKAIAPPPTQNCPQKKQG